MLPSSRLKVHYELPPAAGYRTDGASAVRTGRLTIRLRYFGWRSLLPVLLLLLATAGLGYAWYLALWSRLYLVVSVATVPVVLFVWLRLTAVADGLFIRVADGELLARTSKRWPRVQVTLPSDEIQQLFVLATDRAYGLYARTGDFKTTLLVRQISNPALAWYLERQLEAVLGIADRPVPGELPKVGAAPKGIVPMRSWALQLSFLALFVGAPVGTLRACGQQLAQLSVVDQPKEVRVVVDRPGKAYFTSEVDLATAEHRYREDLPKSVVHRIQLLDGSEILGDLSCDPFEMFAWTTSSSNESIGSFWGPMADCSMALPRTGAFTLRAWRQWDSAKPRIGLEHTIVRMRQR